MRLSRALFSVLVLIALTASSTDSWAELKATKLRDSVVDAEALTIKGNFGQAINGKSFQQDAMVTHGSYQYLGYYDANRRVCIARRRLPTRAKPTGCPVSSSSSPYNLTEYW